MTTNSSLHLASARSRSRIGSFDRPRPIWGREGRGGMGATDRRTSRSIRRSAEAACSACNSCVYTMYAPVEETGRGIAASPPKDNPSLHAAAQEWLTTFVVDVRVD